MPILFKRATLENTKRIRFYTLPPEGTRYPYLLVNPNNYKVLFKMKFDHAILDCGVEIFNYNPKLKDYPLWFLERWKHTAKQLTEIFGNKIWITIPDYPDDYNPGQFGDNVSKTLENIKEFIKIEGVNWLPSIQSRYLDRFSFFESCKNIKDIIGDYSRVAIGTVCKTKNISFIEYCCKVARKFFPSAHIHTFGLTLKALPRVKNLINSWDSLAADCGGRRLWIDNFLQHNSFAKREIRIKYFEAYLKRIEDILKEDENIVS